MTKLTRLKMKMPRGRWVVLFIDPDAGKPMGRRFRRKSQARGFARLTSGRLLRYQKKMWGKPQGGLWQGLNADGALDVISISWSINQTVNALAIDAIIPLIGAAGL